MAEGHFAGRLKHDPEGYRQTFAPGTVCRLSDERLEGASTTTGLLPTTSKVSTQWVLGFVIANRRPTSSATHSFVFSTAVLYTGRFCLPGSCMSLTCGNDWTHRSSGLIVCWICWTAGRLFFAGSLAMVESSHFPHLQHNR